MSKNNKQKSYDWRYQTVSISNQAEYLRWLQESDDDKEEEIPTPEEIFHTTTFSKDEIEFMRKKLKEYDDEDERNPPIPPEERKLIKSDKKNINK